MQLYRYRGREGGCSREPGCHRTPRCRPGGTEGGTPCPASVGVSQVFGSPKFPVAGHWKEADCDVLGCRRHFGKCGRLWGWKLAHC